VIARVAPRRPAPGGGLAVLVVATVLASLVAPHATVLRGLVADALPAIVASEPPGARPASGRRPARAVAFALRQRGKPYRWGAEGPDAFDCSGLTWAAWRAAGVRIPRTAAGQLAGLPRARGRLQPGDLLIYASRGPSRRHVAMVVSPGRMVEAPGRGVPVRSTSIRPGSLGGRPTRRRPMTAFLDLLGWDQPTAAEQAAALVGACLRLAAWLLARALFGGRRQR
jgi:NlpC/P60 family